MQEQKGTFIITREDRAVDALTLVTEGLRIGRLPDCELVLNHPIVSRIHAGISKVDDRFYLTNLSHSNATTLNGRLISADWPEALADGDVIQVGPFSVTASLEHGALHLDVEQQIGVNIGEIETGRIERSAEEVVATSPADPKIADLADAMKIFWAKRTRTKAARPSPLHPLHAPRPGKLRFNWTPTRDLVRPWPFSIFLWSLIAVGIASVAAAVAYSSAYSPRPISASHSRASLTLVPAVAREPNSGSCVHCHSLTTSMESNCASCHRAEGFQPTVIAEHEKAAVGCTSCHLEHRGADFRPGDAALVSCQSCHRTNGSGTYQGRRLSSPHGGNAFGYPVELINNKPQWIWKGLPDNELADKPELIALREPCDQNVSPSKPCDTEQQWRNKQFHGIHLYRVRPVAGITGVETRAGGVKVMSCSSCHKRFATIDRDTPKQTCSLCHSNILNGKIQDPMIAADAPNCASCHVQHLADKHRNRELLVPVLSPAAARQVSESLVQQ